MTTTGRKFTDVEVEEILEQLDSGAALTHEIAKRYECSPTDIWVLWNERNQTR